MKLKENLLFIIICFIAIGCTKQRELLQKAELSSPDSLSFYLQQINHPGRFNSHEKGIYNYLLYTEIVNTRGVGPDSLLEICDACFMESGDVSRWRSVQVSKVVNMLQQKQYDKLLSFADSLLALKKDDDSLCYNLYKNKASAFDRQGKTDEQISCYDKALDIAFRVEDTSWIVDCVPLKIETLEKCDRKREAIALCNELDQMIVHTSNSYSVKSNNRALCEKLYLELGDTIGALGFMDSIKKYRRSRLDAPYEFLARGDIWQSLHRPDSARFYYQLASESTSVYISEVAFQLLYELISLYESPGEVYYLRKKKEAMFQSVLSDLSSKEEYNDFKKLQLINELNVMRLKQKSTEAAVLFVALLVFSIVFIIFFFYQREKRRRQMEKTHYQDELQRMEAERLQQERRTLFSEKVLAEVRANEMEHAKIAGELREMLLRNIPLILKISQQHEDSNQEKQKIEVSEKDWAQIILSVNKGFNDFTLRLKIQHPSLTESEIRFCCLVKIRLSVDDLSNIYCVSPAAIIKRKYRIKKDRMCITDESKSLDLILQEF
ncbi:MAG: hypothetical protein PHV66_08595 [Bacteroidales bacterium]|nr:hypothetical protein [Bacteroidales bacterium]